MEARSAFVYGTLQDGSKVLECLEQARRQEEENVHLIDQDRARVRFST